MGDLHEYITHPTPIDLTSVRDPGMKCLVHLAVSLGWNVHQKQGQPIVITARDGLQKRLPTNTSIRMSVFQTALSSIIVHTDEQTVATIELVDAIIAIHKPSVDHARRLRLAVGETPAQHRDRIASAEAEAKGSRDPQPLTTRLEIPEEQWQMVKELLDHEEEDDEVAARAAMADYVAADGGEHGEVVSREPYQAIKQTGVANVIRYVSDTSYERKWNDGYVDYECTTCGKAFATTKGVGSHSQIHRDTKVETKAWQRTEVIKEPRAATELVWENPPSEEEPIVVRLSVETGEPVLTNINDSFLLGQIAALVAPDLVAKIQMLEGENQFLKDRLEEVEGEFDAFVDLAISRRKKPDGD